MKKKSLEKSLELTPHGQPVDLDGYYQTVTLVFLDGRQFVATGPAVCTEAEAPSMGVSDIQFSPPKKLPVGQRFKFGDP